MSELYRIELEINTQNWSNENKIHSNYSLSSKYGSKIKEMSGEIINCKISENILYFQKNFIRRYNSFSYIGTKEKLYNNENEKMGFKEWISYHKESHEKLSNSVLKLLIEIFDKRCRLYPNNVCSLPQYCELFKKNLDIFILKYYELSVYILYILYKQIIPFLEYIINKMNSKLIKFTQCNIEEILYFIGKDLKDIFQNILDKTENFEFSSILIVMFQKHLFKDENKIKKHKITSSSLYKEKGILDDFLEKNKNLKFISNYIDHLNKMLLINCDYRSEGVQIKDKISNEEINVNKDDDINEQTDESLDNDKETNIQKLNIEELINYINEPDNKEKKKKKRKRKKGKNKKENNYIEQDLIILDYKKAMEDYTKSSLYMEKIKPKYSENFINWLKKLNQ